MITTICRGCGKSTGLNQNGLCYTCAPNPVKAPEPTTPHCPTKTGRGARFLRWLGELPERCSFCPELLYPVTFAVLIVVLAVADGCSG